MKYYTVKEVAQTFRVNEYTVRRWAKEQRVPSIKAGRRWLFKSLDLFANNPLINLNDSNGGEKRSMDTNTPIVSEILGDNPQGENQS